MKFFTQKDLDEATSKLESAIEARARKKQLKIEAAAVIEAAQTAYSKAMDDESEATDAVCDARLTLNNIKSSDESDEAVQCTRKDISRGQCFINKTGMFQSVPYYWPNHGEIRKELPSGWVFAEDLYRDNDEVELLEHYTTHPVPTRLSTRLETDVCVCSHTRLYHMYGPGTVFSCHYISSNNSSKTKCECLRFTKDKLCSDLECGHPLVFHDRVRGRCNARGPYCLCRNLIPDTDVADSDRMAARINE